MSFTISIKHLPYLPLSAPDIHIRSKKVVLFFFSALADSEIHVEYRLQRNRQYVPLGHTHRCEPI